MNQFGLLEPDPHSCMEVVHLEDDEAEDNLLSEEHEVCKAGPFLEASSNFHGVATKSTLCGGYRKCQPRRGQQRGR